MTIVRTIDGKQHEIELTEEEISQITREYDSSCRAVDILGKIKEKIAEVFEELSWFGANSDVVEHMVMLDEAKALEAADDMVYSVDHRLSRNDGYWDRLWDTVNEVIDDELCGTDYEPDEITVGYHKGHIHIMVEGRVVANISEQEIKIIDFDFFADADNRDIVAKKLAELDEDTIQAA